MRGQWLAGQHPTTCSPGWKFQSNRGISTLCRARLVDRKVVDVLSSAEHYPQIRIVSQSELASRFGFDVDLRAMTALFRQIHRKSWYPSPEPEGSNRPLSGAPWSKYSQGGLPTDVQAVSGWRGEGFAGFESNLPLFGGGVRYAYAP